jgi:cyclopropane-fatty-acyl-phospholipid synthase
MQAILDQLSARMGPGVLELQTPGGRHYRIGRDGPSAPVLVRNLPRFMRALFNPGLSMGEAYVDGDWDPADGDLLNALHAGMALTRIAEHPRDLARKLIKRFSRVQASLNEFNTPFRARRNVSHHYDLDRELYAAFLDSGMFYSCAYFRDANMGLEEAQQAKCAHVAAKLNLRPGARVLDIGCGWGGLALFIAQHYDVHVTGITLSVEQLAVAQARVREAGLESRIDLRLEDYRKTRGEFDGIVSVGMFEHVGRPQYAEFFHCLERLLKPDGVAVIHTIGRCGRPGVTNPWVAKYIFPGGYIPAASEVETAIEPTALELSDLEIWRLHYALTLAEWHRRFNIHRALFRERLGEPFCRMWDFYLQGSEASFRWGDLVVFQFQLLRDRARLPLTRDYLYV